MSKYITNSGDRWDSIAYKQLGDVKYTTDLMQANVKHINITIFPAGVVLTIPKVKESISSNLPPWKRVDV